MTKVAIRSVIRVHDYSLCVESWNWTGHQASCCFISRMLETKKYLDSSFFMNYVILNLYDKKKTKNERIINRYALRKLMDEFLASNRQYSLKDFKKLLIEEFKQAQKKEEKTDKVIIKKFEHLIKEYKKNKQKALDNLR